MAILGLRVAAGLGASPLRDKGGKRKLAVPSLQAKASTDVLCYVFTIYVTFIRTNIILKTQ